MGVERVCSSSSMRRRPSRTRRATRRTSRRELRCRTSRRELRFRTRRLRVCPKRLLRWLSRGEASNVRDVGSLARSWCVAFSLLCGYNVLMTECGPGNVYALNSRTIGLQKGTTISVAVFVDLECSCQAHLRFEGFPFGRSINYSSEHSPHYCNSQGPLMQPAPK